MDQNSLEALESLNEVRLTPAEKEKMLSVFDAMRAEEEKLGEIDTQNVEIMVHVMPMTNVLREDVRSQPFSRSDLLAGGPEHTGDSWQVPRLVR